MDVRLHPSQEFHFENMTTCRGNRVIALSFANSAVVGGESALVGGDLAVVGGDWAVLGGDSAVLGI